MSKLEKTLRRILAATADKNISFGEPCRLLHELGFTERVRGSHHIFARQGVDEIVNLQPLRGEAKPYQVRQVRELILRYRLGGGHHAE